MSTNDTPAFGDRLQARVSGWVGRPRVWLAFVCVIASYPFIHVATHPLPDPIPIYDQLPEFALTDHRGEMIGIWTDVSPRERAIEVCEEVSKRFPGSPIPPDVICETGRAHADMSAMCDACIDARERGRKHTNLAGKMWVAAVLCTDCDSFRQEDIESLQKIQHHARAMGKYFKIVTFTADPTKDTPEALTAYAKSVRASKGMWSFVTGKPTEVQPVIDQLFHQATTTKRVPTDDATYHQVAIVDPGRYIRGYYDLRDKAAVDQCLRDIGLVANRGY